MNVVEYYERTLAERGYQSDATQKAAIARLQQLYDAWQKFDRQRSNIFMRMVSKPQPPMGVYLWGGVGRGKSFLMDSFYSVVPVKEKVRIHFHEFMRAIHRQLDELKGVEDPLDEVARRVAKKYRLICFDEFHVSDVADAMVLYNLLRVLFEEGVSFVMTSNYEPSTLYPDGLHRNRMLPTIALLQAKMDVLNVDTGVDYRKRSLEQIEAYYTPLGEPAEAALKDTFYKLADAHEENREVDVEGRTLISVRRAGGAIWFDWETLCNGPRSQNDYLELASRFHTVILSDIPEMSASMSSPARRFTWLIDVFYDHKVKLFMSAAVPPEELYTHGVMSNEFHRTVSRIVEMQSREYLEAERRGATQQLT